MVSWILAALNTSVNAGSWSDCLLLLHSLRTWATESSLLCGGFLQSTINDKHISGCQFIELGESNKVRRDHNQLSIHYGSNVQKPGWLQPLAELWPLFCPLVENSFFPLGKPADPLHSPSHQYKLVPILFVLLYWTDVHRVMATDQLTTFVMAGQASQIPLSSTLFYPPQFDIWLPTGAATQCHL